MTQPDALDRAAKVLYDGSDRGITEWEDLPEAARENGRQWAREAFEAAEDHMSNTDTTRIVVGTMCSCDDPADCYDHWELFADPVGFNEETGHMRQGRKLNEAELRALVACWEAEGVEYAKDMERLGLRAAASGGTPTEVRSETYDRVWHALVAAVPDIYRDVAKGKDTPSLIADEVMERVVQAICGDRFADPWAASGETPEPDLVQRLAAALVDQGYGTKRRDCDASTLIDAMFAEPAASGETPTEDAR